MSSAPVDRAVLHQLQAFFHCDHVGIGDYIDIVCVYMYGSVARGEARGASDIDVAVLYAQEPPPTLDGLGLGWLHAERSWETGDLVISIAPHLIHRVLRDGVLVYDDPPVSALVQARSAYFDLLPYPRQYRRAIPGCRRDR
jgi:predicted nucleotidyltransferase